MKNLPFLFAASVACLIGTLAALGILGCAAVSEPPLRVTTPIAEGHRADYLHCIADVAIERGYTVTFSDANLGVLHLKRGTTLIVEGDYIEATAPRKTSSLVVYSFDRVWKVSDGARSDADAIAEACLSVTPAPEGPEQ